MTLSWRHPAMWMDAPVKMPAQTAVTVLTVRPPNDDGVWQLSLTRDGEEVLIDPSSPPDYSEAMADSLALDVEDDSDANAAAAHAVELLAEDFDIEVDVVVYPDGSREVQ